MPGPQPLSQPLQHKECPQTPIGRLPLAELIAAVDDNAYRNLDLTPGERVLWQHVPGSSQLSSSQPTKTSKHGKKRARSSSPSSSSQNEASNHFSNKQQSFDLQTLQKTLKTPQADPAADLWTSYSLKTGGVRNGSPTRCETSFTELLRSSSPQTPGSHLKTRELTGLRRSISCANEWPTSAAKRRRLNHGGSQYQVVDDLIPEKQECAKMLRMNLLVEQVQKALSRSRAKDAKSNPHFDSSPSPDKGSATDQFQSSPTHRIRDHGNQEQKLQEPVLPTITTVQEQIAQEDHVEIADKASEFEDDDLDDDELLEAIDASLAPGPQVHASFGNAVPPTVKRQMSAERPLTTSEPSNIAIVRPERTTTQDETNYSTPSTQNFKISEESQARPASRDDYDDGDDDMSAADLEDLVAVYDEQGQDVLKQSHQHPIPGIAVRKPLAELDQPIASVTRNKAHTAQEKDHVIDVSSDEEFGEGADFEDIVSQCTAASQPSSQNQSVRAR